MDEMSNKNKQINLDENALYLEYTKGVNPIRAGTIKSIPFKSFLVILISPFKIIISIALALRRFFYNKEK